MDEETSDHDASGESGSDNESDTASDNGVPAVVEFAATSATDGDRHGDYCIQFPTRDIWSSAFSSVLVAMEANWYDSSSALMRRPLPDVPDILISSDRAVEYARFRKASLELVDAACRLGFEKQRKTRAGSGKGKNAEDHGIMACAYPGNAKLKLIALVDRMALSLKKSLRLVSRYIRKDENSGIGLVEAIAALLAWVDQDSREPDFSIGAHNWDRAQKSGGREDPIYARLSKTATRLEGLGTLLSNLRSLLGKLLPGTLGMSRLQRMEDFISRVRNTKNEGKQSSALVALFDAKLRSISSLRSELYSPAQNIRAKRTASTLVPASRKKRRGVVQRSRNPTVDMWLQLDRANGEDDDDDDAYADLEDFLVEG
mmetsp:Transcript_31983/g.73507  ORF Transcript_31983/g.73507 Transcript_31983/m.73507 type:complete len:372 (+) Transcript_31983:2-1117(+)